MKIEKQEITALKFSYAVSWFHRCGRLYGVAASEMAEGGKCIMFPMDHPDQIETIWENAGGTMSIAQIREDGSFLAVQNFFKGFQSSTACIVKAVPAESGGWSVEKYLDLPYVHRFEIVTVGENPFLLAATLCDKKDFRDDWSHPGRVYLGRMTKEGRDCRLMTLINGITKNHGYCQMMHDGRHVVAVTGQEGLFEITVPENPDGEWKYENLIPTEISDVTFVDLDQDGTDEIVTIEKFHGNQIVIYKKDGQNWNRVYSYPVNFGHVVWGGRILGKPGLLVAYREDNAALILMRLRKSEQNRFYMEHTVLDEHEGPTNLAVTGDDSICRILCSCGKTERVVVYTLVK